MELKPEQLSNIAAKTTLYPIYLIAGGEILRVLEAADGVRKHVRSKGISEREVYNADSRDFDWNTLEVAFNSPSLFSPQRLIELRLGSGKVNKEGSQLMVSFCENPPPDIVLLITLNEWGKAYQGKWSEAIARVGATATAWPIKPHELSDWIDRRMHSKGLKATPEAVKLLSERVEGNLLAAAQEVDKLALLADDQPLTAEKLETLVADAARYDVFRLMDAVLDGQTNLVSRILLGLRAEGEQVAGLMPMIIKEVLRTSQLAKAQARGANLASEMKSQGIWEAKQAPFKRALQRHSQAIRWERFVAVASRIDRAAKGRGEGDPWVLLERLLLAIAEPKAVRLLVK